MAIGDQIKHYRKQRKITQNVLAEKMEVSERTVHNWEHNVFEPTTDNLHQLAKILKVTEAQLLGSEKFAAAPRLFDEAHMERQIEERLNNGDFPQSKTAMAYIKETRKNDFRINLEKEKVPYIYHPYLMVCQVFAMGIEDTATAKLDDVVAACFLHDVFEKGTQFESMVAERELKNKGISEKVINVCKLIIRPEGTMLKKDHVNKMAEDPFASLIKCLSRCSNLSTIHTITKKAHRHRCINETEQHYPKLLDAVKKKEPGWYNAAFLLSYQIKSLCEAYKLLG